MVILQINNISKSFKELKAVDKVNFQVEKGEIFGLLGPNGAGKSTTISMISTLLTPDEGEILYKEIDIKKKPRLLQKELGYVPQEIALYPSLSGYENLKFFGRAYGLRGKQLKKRIEEVSEIIGIKERLKDTVDKYSGGMKRRINIGVALLHEPELIIMDEPTVGIDPQSRNYILEGVKALNAAGSTIIYTSHYMEEVEQLCDKICIMDKGKVIALDTKEGLFELMSDSKTIRLQVEKNDKEVIALLEQIHGVESIKVDEGFLRGKVKDEIIFIKEVTRIMTETNNTLLSYAIEQPNLEAVFLELTGKKLRD